MDWVLSLLLGCFWIALPFVVWHRVNRTQRELNQLRDRFNWLERELATRAASPVDVRPPGVSVHPDPAPGLSPISAPVEPVAVAAPIADAPVPLGAVLAAKVSDAPASPGANLAQARVQASVAPSAAHEALEDRVGSVWLQNAGAVVLLLGVFFFILWGYTTGRFGAEVLVGTGIGLGLLSAWRGDRLSRSLPRLGHAFIGVGLGIVYLSIYLGHFTLHVVPRPLAAVLTLLVAFATIGAGLRYRVQTIAAIGVIGAFLPQLLVSWLELRGFWLEPSSFLGYLVLVDILVFALAARAGWSALDLAALCLTMLTWQSTFPSGDWGWPITLGLAALFIGLGLAPLPRLVRVEGRVRDIDLAVVAGAPVLLLLSLWGWFEKHSSTSVASLMFSLAAVQWVAALWVDRQRSERDLWRPLSGAAIVFLTAGLQRIVGNDNLALTWALEGVLLVLLGLAPRSGWLRLCGHIVLTMAGVVTLFDSAWWQDVHSNILSLHAESLRGAGLIALLAIGATLLARRRAVLAPLERWAPEVWSAAAGALFLLWSWHRCSEVVAFAQWPVSAWWQGAWPPTADASVRRAERFTALLALVWALPAAGLAWRGARAGGGFLRTCAHVFGLLVLGALLATSGASDGWSSGQWPVLHPVGIGIAACLAIMFVTALGLAAKRTRLSQFERRAPEVWASGFLLVLLLWSAREAGHVATAVLGPVMPNQDRDLWVAHHTLAAALTSAAWLLEALILLALGWLRRTAFLRWAGLLLIGVTLLKFMFYDLANADVFWRFVTAIAAGAAMLVVSYVYQRRAKSRRARELADAPPVAPAPE